MRMYGKHFVSIYLEHPLEDNIYIYMYIVEGQRPGQLRRARDKTILDYPRVQRETWLHPTL